MEYYRIFPVLSFLFSYFRFFPNFFFSTGFFCDIVFFRFCSFRKKCPFVNFFLFYIFFTIPFLNLFFVLSRHFFKYFIYVFKVFLHVLLYVHVCDENPSFIFCHHTRLGEIFPTVFILYIVLPFFIFIHISFKTLFLYFFLHVLTLLCNLFSRYFFLCLRYC